MKNSPAETKRAEDEKTVDRFLERLLDIAIMQVEAENENTLSTPELD